MKKNKQFAFIIVAILCTLIDQITKYITDYVLDLNQNISVIANILSFEKLYNSGAAFSIMQSHTLSLILISLLALLLILLFVFRYNDKTTMSEIVALGFITGGALGNLIDRIFRYFVIDFIQLDFVKFPVFNFADVFINIGVIILIVSIIANRK